MMFLARSVLAAGQAAILKDYDTTGVVGLTGSVTATQLVHRGLSNSDKHSRDTHCSSPVEQGPL